MEGNEIRRKLIMLDKVKKDQDLEFLDRIVVIRMCELNYSVDNII